MIPHCDELFMRFFDPWYGDQWKRYKGFEATRPDVQSRRDFVGVPVSDLSPLDEEGQTEASRLVNAMLDSVKEDWPTYLQVTPPVDLDWVDKADRFYNRSRIEALIAESNSEDLSNPYVVTCCQFGAVLGKTLVDNGTNLEWLYAWPYWESSLLHTPTGTIVPVFHWAIKKFSEYGVDDGFSAKLKACCNLFKK